MDNLRCEIIEAGYCTHPEWVTLKTASFKSCIFPANVAVIDHPQKGIILFDSGYSSRFYTATRKFPQKLYRLITPVHINDTISAKNKLKEMGISHLDVKYIIISHFHADHIAGLADFPKAKYIYFKHGFDAVKDLKPFAAVRNGFISSLLPNDFIERSQAIDINTSTTSPTNISFFPYGYDIFQDGTLMAIQLPGHATGQLGLKLKANNKTHFFIADAAWKKETIMNNTLPSVVGMFIQKNKQEYKNTINKLHKLYLENNDIDIIPCHCRNQS